MPFLASPGATVRVSLPFTGTVDVSGVSTRGYSWRVVNSSTGLVSFGRVGFPPSDQTAGGYNVVPVASASGSGPIAVDFSVPSSGVDAATNTLYLQAENGTPEPNNVNNYSDTYHFGSVPPSVPGCTDPAATNYNASATVNDGSCVYSGGGTGNPTGGGGTGTPTGGGGTGTPPSGGGGGGGGGGGAPGGGFTGPSSPTTPGVCVPLVWTGGPGFITGVGAVGTGGSVMVCPVATTPYMFTPAGGTPITVIVTVTPTPLADDCPCEWIADARPSGCEWVADKRC